MTTWTISPDAARLLRSCAAQPPSVRVRTDRFKDTWTEYVGQRVAALRCFYLAAEPPVDSVEWRVWLELTPQVAIAQAIASAPTMAAAE